MTITASPLTWPEGWKRTPEHKRIPAKFGKATHFSGVAGQGGKYVRGRALTVAEGIKRVRDELMRIAIGMTDEDFIVSTNLRMRRCNERA